MVAPANIIYKNIIHIQFRDSLRNELFMQHVITFTASVQTFTEYKHLQTFTASKHVFHISYSSYKYLSSCKASENDHISWNFCAFNVIRSANLRIATSRMKHLAENLLREILIL